jgi:hypothetical protein
LNQAAFDCAPFLTRHQDRDKVELPRARHATGIIVNIIGDPVLPQQTSCIELPAQKFLCAEFLEGANQVVPVRTHVPYCGAHLIV